MVKVNNSRLVFNEERRPVASMHNMASTEAGVRAPARVGIFLTFPEGEKKEGRLESTHVFLHVQYKKCGIFEQTKKGVVGGLVTSQKLKF